MTLTWEMVGAMYYGLVLSLLLVVIACFVINGRGGPPRAGW